MARQCPYCRRSDLDDDALKCPHCASWLDPAKQTDEFQAYRRGLQAELAEALDRQQKILAADLQEHRAYTEKLLTRMQLFAGVIAAIAGGFAIYFTGVTKENITQTTARIEEDAQKKVENAAEQATLRATALADETVRQRVVAAIGEKLAAPETQAQIERGIGETLASAVRDEVEARVAPIQTEIDSRTAAARTALDAVSARIAAVATEAEATVQGVRQIEASFASARALDLGATSSVLDFTTVEGGGKEGLDRLPELVARGINALTFTLGQGGYWGPVVWKYLDRLDAVPQFQWVVLLAPDGHQAVGYWPARALAQALNPPDNARIAAGLGADPYALPDEQTIPEWTRFAEMVNRGDAGGLAQIPGFHAIDEAAAPDWTNFQALERMVGLALDQLPVVDAGGALVGFVDRSRLTTQMLLEVAARQN